MSYQEIDPSAALERIQETPELQVLDVREPWVHEKVHIEGVQLIPLGEIEARHASDRAFVAAIDDVLPDGAAVFQVPVLDFPETIPPGRMEDYDPLRAYLADTGTLRWSYGAVKGRPEADWQARVRDDVGLLGALPGLLGLGFEGLWVDTWG